MIMIMPSDILLRNTIHMTMLCEEVMEYVNDPKETTMCIM